MKENKIKQAEHREIARSQINFAAYNPRTITDEARKKLKANLKRIGLLGGVVWNEDTGNLVSGHQKVAIMDEVNHYDIETQENDYIICVEVAHFDEVTEKEQNLFMNNRQVQGTFDEAMLSELLEGINYENAGYDDFDISLLMNFDLEEYVEEPEQHETWHESQITGVKNQTERYEDKRNGVEEENTELTDEQKRMKEMSDRVRGEAENTKIDKSVNFYEDTPENQIARHREVQKIKDRINDKADINNDGGSLSYVTISFPTFEAKARFMEEWGYDIFDKYIDSADFIRKLEFGFE